MFGAFFAQSGLEDIEVSVFLVDDGSTDVTGQAVRTRFPDVSILTGDGSLFWNGGMHLAFGKALTAGFDYYLWLNDDMLFYPNALSVMLKTHRNLVSQNKAESIMVASTRDPATGELTYGGHINTGQLFNLLRLRLVLPENEVVQCDTM